MKNLQISDNDIIGRRFNGHDLHFYLQNRGIESHQIVWNKQSQDPTSYQLAKNFNNRQTFHQIINHLNDTLAVQGRYYPFSHQMMYEKEFLQADIIHYHLIHNNFFDISDLPILSKLKPTVWTLHDPWALTGHCIHPMECDRWKTGCGDCPQLTVPKSLNYDTTALNWELKKQYYAQSKIDLIVSSQWMYKRVKQSPLLKDKPLHVIPFGLDLEVFRPIDTHLAKEKLGIDTSHIVLCFRASESEFKGLDIILECLEKMNTNRMITLLTIDHSQRLTKRFGHRFNIVELKWVSDDEVLVNAYNAADIFLMPSSAESFGMMAMEAMACGKPAIVMSGTALEEVVLPDQGGGVVVQQGDVPAFISQVEKLIGDDDERHRMGFRARELAEKHYSAERYVSDVIEVYKTVLARADKDPRAEYLAEQLSRISPDSERLYLNDIVISFRYKSLTKQIKQNRIIRYVYYNLLKPFLDKI